MKGFLPKSPKDFYDLSGKKVAIIASMWHIDCVNNMINRASQELNRLNISSIDTHYLPGSLELPTAAKLLFKKFKDLDAIIAFGVVLKGSTTHDDSVIQTVVNGFNTLSLEFEKPIINEVIGVNTMEDAVARSDNSESNKGVEAVFALSEYMRFKDSLNK